MKRRILIIMASAIIGLLTLTGCGASSKASSQTESIAPTPVLVRVASVEHSGHDLPVHAIGRLEAKEELQLSFKTGGIVERVLVDEGSKVVKGDLLATLRLTEFDALLAQAQTNFDKTARDLERFTRLYGDSIITLEQLQNVTTAWEVAKAALGAAAFNRKCAEIHAPSTGRILRRLADDHEQAAPGSPVFILAGYEKGWIVRSGLADRDLMRVKTGDSAQIEFDALPGEQIKGVISQIGAAPNVMNGTYEIEIRIVPSENRLVTGLIGKVTISPPLAGQMSLVPVESLVEADGSTGFVFAPTPERNTARKVPVTVSYLHGGKAAIMGELPGIESVITAGATKLSDGARVTIVK